MSFQKVDFKALAALADMPKVAEANTALEASKIAPLLPELVATKASQESLFMVFRTRGFPYRRCMQCCELRSRIRPFQYSGGNCGYSPKAPILPFAQPSYYRRGTHHRIQCLWTSRTCIQELSDCTASLCAHRKGRDTRRRMVKGSLTGLASRC